MDDLLCRFPRVIYSLCILSLPIFSLSINHMELFWVIALLEWDNFMSRCPFYFSFFMRHSPSDQKEGTWRPALVWFSTTCVTGIMDRLDEKIGGQNWGKNAS